MVSSSPTNQNSLLIRIKIKISQLLLQPSFIIGSILVIILTYLVIAPIISIFLTLFLNNDGCNVIRGKMERLLTVHRQVFTSSISKKSFGRL